ncbi:DUF2059 domain-containing protein [Parasphingopyxis lamellibrachiae]|uniref:Uncharacterized protein DUF2059 n=1 Tax=Parasphingopyxis lamellibrachiae TaxID=680125 RepID=A0A3D9FKS7_9SPHN|nr:DUF2059 domain-containing protein [Parasphingopyxis lamellibrachiae]RED17706.1 uncharacterized protein DUF2059 [Parasphingopyxis lamellibrachiae]
MKINPFLIGLAALALPFHTPMQAQSESRASTDGDQASPVTILVPEPERVEAARELLDILMPPDQREAMMIAMIEPMIANLEAGMMQAPELEAALSDNPDVRTLFMEFMVVQRARALESATADLPSMIEAMSCAYARRFTRREMREIGEFFETEAGRAYLQQSNSIMADPDIAAWQRGTMARSMQHLQTDIRDFMTRLAALQGSDGASAPRDVTTSNLDAMRGGTQASETETEE